MQHKWNITINYHHSSKQGYYSITQQKEETEGKKYLLCELVLLELCSDDDLELSSDETCRASNRNKMVKSRAWTGGEEGEEGGEGERGPGELLGREQMVLRFLSSDGNPRCPCSPCTQNRNKLS